jgi:hypothetical protein
MFKKTDPAIKNISVVLLVKTGNNLADLLSGE